MGIAVRDGICVEVTRMDGTEEQYWQPTPGEARARAAFVGEGLSWVGTPFVDCGDVKGRNGAVDCAMLLVRSAVDTGLATPFDPRPYSPRRMLHSDEEKFLEWVVDRLGGVETASPQPGDVVVWRFGRCFSHGGILASSEEVVHAYGAAGMCLVSRLDEPVLREVPAGGGLTAPRPVRYFDMMRGLKCPRS